MAPAQICGVMEMIENSLCALEGTQSRILVAVVRYCLLPKGLRQVSLQRAVLTITGFAVQLQTGPNGVCYLQIPGQSCVSAMWFLFGEFYDICGDEIPGFSIDKQI